MISRGLATGLFVSRGLGTPLSRAAIALRMAFRSVVETASSFMTGGSPLSHTTAHDHDQSTELERTDVQTQKDQQP